jgi:hypothetical protein
MAAPIAASRVADRRPTRTRTKREKTSAPTPNDAATNPATAAEDPSSCTAGAR